MKPSKRQRLFVRLIVEHHDSLPVHEIRLTPDGMGYWSTPRKNYAEFLRAQADTGNTGSKDYVYALALREIGAR